MSRSHPPTPVEVVLSQSGHVARLSADPFRRSGLILTVDGVAQSHVNPDDPTDLAFDYIQRIAHVVDLSQLPTKPITALHLGAGALTIPRYIHHTRPGSAQVVIEWEPEIVEIVREQAPWDDETIQIMIGDARESLESLEREQRFDLVVVDLFSGNQTPSHLTTTEFYRLISERLTPDGVVAVNVVDGGDQAFARRACRTLAEHFGFVGACGEAQVVRGQLFGNLVIVACASRSEPQWWDQLSRLGPHPTATIDGDLMRNFTRDALIQRDSDLLPSPQLSRSHP